MRNIWRVIRFIPEYRGRILGVFVVGTVLGAVSTATPFLYKHIVDVIAALLSGQVSAQQASASVAVLLSLFFGLRVLMVLFSALQDKQSDDLWLDTVSTFRQRVFDNMTRMSIDYFEKKRVGEIMDRFGHITTITMWLFSLTEGTLANILQLFFIVAMLLWKAPVIGLIMVAVVALNLLLSYRTVHATQPYRRGWQRLAGRMSGLLAEMISNVATVRSFGGEPAVKQRYDEYSGRVEADARCLAQARMACQPVAQPGQCRRLVPDRRAGGAWRIERPLQSRRCAVRTDVGTESDQYDCADFAPAESNGRYRKQCGTPGRIAGCTGAIGGSPRRYTVARYRHDRVRSCQLLLPGPVATDLA